MTAACVLVKPTSRWHLKATSTRRTAGFGGSGVKSLPPRARRAVVAPAVRAANFRSSRRCMGSCVSAWAMVGGTRQFIPSACECSEDCHDDESWNSAEALFCLRQNQFFGLEHDLHNSSVEEDTSSVCD